MVPVKGHRGEPGARDTRHARDKRHTDHTDGTGKPVRGSGVVWRVSLWVGLVLRLVCEVLVSVSCPGSPRRCL